MTEARTRDQAARDARAAARPHRGRRPWPVPTDTATDRARTIGRGLYAALLRVDPTAAAAIAEKAEEFGEGWLTASLDLSDDDRRLTVRAAAALVGRQPATIYQWCTRGTRHGQLARGADGRISEHELLDLDAAMRRPTTKDVPRAC